VATRKSFLLRISPDLYAKLERWAADELRSANAQIEYLLTDAVRRAGRDGRSAVRTDAADPVASEHRD
jgi:hypothetical protein